MDMRLSLHAAAVTNDIATQRKEKQIYVSFSHLSFFATFQNIKIMSLKQPTAQPTELFKKKEKKKKVKPCFIQFSSPVHQF